MNISIRSLRSFDNFLFKFNVSLPLVTGELLQNTVDVNNVNNVNVNVYVYVNVNVNVYVNVNNHIINIYRVLKKLPGN